MYCTCVGKNDNESMVELLKQPGRYYAYCVYKMVFCLGHVKAIVYLGQDDTS